VRLRNLSLVVVFILSASIGILGQETQPAPAAGIPAATRSEMDCSGFITTTAVSKDTYVFEGADNDFHHPQHGWAEGEFVFLRSRSGNNFAVGNEFSLVRSAKYLFRLNHYDGQSASVRSLGKPYEDVAQVKVTQVTPFGAVAQVTFPCGPINAGDLAVPYRARPIPTYTPLTPLDRFTPPNYKLVGAITAGVGNTAYLGAGRMAYISLGRSDGAAPGQKYRIFHIMRESLSVGLTVPPEPPREIIGELVILSSEENASVAMIVQSTRAVSLGDGIEQE